MPDEIKNNPDPTKRYADGPEGWMDAWTMFYWGWWISWCPFVGMFIAKISKGRTIKQFINGTMTAPVLYSFMWLIIFGGAGIRQEREAGNFGKTLGTSCHSKLFNFPTSNSHICLIIIIFEKYVFSYE